MKIILKKIMSFVAHITLALLVSTPVTTVTADESDTNFNNTSPSSDDTLPSAEQSMSEAMNALNQADYRKFKESASEQKLFTEDK